ncbi:hypothetical protein CsatB_004814 [Cannabis sativa]|uniref:Uncharacterized protein n=1 Tax=Cannabis sativa TaxID=3483 RepID=A0A803R6S0_CANSA
MSSKHNMTIILLMVFLIFSLGVEEVRGADCVYIDRKCREKKECGAPCKAKNYSEFNVECVLDPSKSPSDSPYCCCLVDQI